MKKVLFIDVDGVLNIYNDENGITWREERDEFLDWAAVHFECRYLTAWGIELHQELPLKWRFPMEDWRTNKAEALWRLPKERTWVFLDDDHWDLSNVLANGEFVLIDGEKVGELRRVMATLKP